MRMGLCGRAPHVMCTVDEPMLMAESCMMCLCAQKYGSFYEGSVN